MTAGRQVVRPIRNRRAARAGSPVQVPKPCANDNARPEPGRAREVKAGAAYIREATFSQFTRLSRKFLR